MMYFVLLVEQTISRVPHQEHLTVDVIHVAVNVV